MNALTGVRTVLDDIREDGDFRRLTLGCWVGLAVGVVSLLVGLAVCVARLVG